LICPSKMVVFHSFVDLPEGIFDGAMGMGD
jgi:hypothetical protein